MGLGACSAVVASIAEILLGLLPFFHGRGTAAGAISSFLQVAPVEEMCKLGVVLAFVWRNPNFNEENDGIVYVGASAIGFALLENILYVAENGIGTGVLRAISAMPLHVFTAVVLGLHVGRARFAADRGTRILLIARGLALVPEGRGVFARLTVAENLMMGAYHRRDASGIATDLERIYGLLPRLMERKAQVAGTLSGGEQQMLAIGRALMGRPRLLLLDEPSMGLAPLMVQKVFEVVRKVAAEGMTILLVEQNARLALEVCSRGYVMESGSITLADSSAALLADSRVRTAYLGE